MNPFPSRLILLILADHFETKTLRKDENRLQEAIFWPKTKSGTVIADTPVTL